MAFKRGWLLAVGAMPERSRVCGPYAPGHQCKVESAHER
jgi:hypothetical protein